MFLLIKASTMFEANMCALSRGLTAYNTTVVKEGFEYGVHVMEDTNLRAIIPVWFGEMWSYEQANHLCGYHKEFPNGTLLWYKWDN